MAEMNSTYNNHRLLHEPLYATYVGVMALLMQTIAGMVEFTSENKKRMGVALATLLVNFIATLWGLSLTSDVHHNYWKTTIFNVVFNFTGILTPYSVFSMLIPQWLTWHGFAIICTGVAFMNGHNELQLMLIWFYQKLLDFVKYLTEKLSILIIESQLPMDDTMPQV